MQHDLTSNDYDRLGTFDIETTHYDPEQGETVSIGIGIHTRGKPASDAEYITLHRKPALDESELIRSAFEALDDADVDALVTYKGTEFDFEFLNDRLTLQDETPPSASIGEHVDLFTPRKQKAELQNKKWPNLEECLRAYNYEPPTTIWRGKPVSNTRFGEELGPAVLDSIDRGDQRQWEQLIDVVDHYLITDLEANLAIYHGDIGVDFQPHHLGDRAEFDV